MLQVFTAGAAFVAAVASLWNVYQFAASKGRVDALERGHNSHVKAPALHGFGAAAGTGPLVEQLLRRGVGGTVAERVEREEP